MLNENQVRELAYIVKIDDIKPIPNYDRVEYARVGGWWVIVGKNQFKIGDPAVYIEVDSRVPEVEPFLFLEKRHYKVKTLKMCGVVSQGLLMSIEDFNWSIVNTDPIVIISTNKISLIVGDFVTELLGITYAEDEDNKRKAVPATKEMRIRQKHPKFFRNPIIKSIMRNPTGRKILTTLLNTKKNKKEEFPNWVKITDEERCQNMPYLFPGNPNETWYATEKIDGTSTTFTLKKINKFKYDYRVCSRRVSFAGKGKKKIGYYDTNVYLEMAEKYHAEDILKKLFAAYKDLSFVTIQGETYGKSIQKREYGLADHQFMAFNLIFGYKNGETVRLNPSKMTEVLEPLGIPCVPIISCSFKVPSTCEELLTIATGASQLDGGMREGLVFRSEDGVRSFKAVSNEYLLKYHS